MRVPTDSWRKAVRLHPESHDFVPRPYRHGAANVPENVIPELIVKEEIRIVGSEPSALILVVRALRLSSIQPSMPPADKHDQQHQIADEEEHNPIGRKAFHPLHVRREIQPRNDSKAEEESQPWQEKAWKAE